MTLTLGGPPSLDDVEPVPHGRTAQRLTWPHLPPPLRALVERRLGSAVIEATSQDAGFTPGFASRLVGEDGSRLFVKAANRQAQRRIAAAYAEEARKLRLLPAAALPVPRLLWTHEDDRWVVLGFEDVGGRAPRRPWRRPELERGLDALVRVHEVLPTAPAGLGLDPLHEDLPTLVTGWDSVAADSPGWPHLDELRRLARTFAALPDRAFVHADVRDDNLILAEDGRTLICDWNWPALGPAWIDAVAVLASARADGVDVDGLLGSCPLTVSVPDEQVDAWLAALCGFMVEADRHPAPPAAPALGLHRRWWAAALWSWLSSRRGWV